jgi:hypothetical protein
MLIKLGVEIISEEIESHFKIKFIIAFTASLFILLPAASAASVNAKNVQETPEYVNATALCSCGLNGYHYMTGCFENYCPKCHSYGTLSFNPKGTPEGEWTCTKCGSDYCAADGKEKMPGVNVFLKLYTPPNSTQSGNTPEVHAQDVTTGNQDLLNEITYYNGKSFLNI